MPIILPESEIETFPEKSNTTNTDDLVIVSTEIKNSKKLTVELKSEIEKALQNVSSGDLKELKENLSEIIEGWSKYGLDFYKIIADKSVTICSKHSEFIKFKLENQRLNQELDIKTIDTEVAVIQSYYQILNKTNIFDDLKDKDECDWVLVFPLYYSKFGILVHKNINPKYKYNFEFYFVLASDEVKD